MTTINKDTKFPAYVVWFLISMSVAGALGWADIHNQLAKLNHEAMTQDQFRDWKETARIINRVNYPALDWPQLPPKVQ